MALNDVWRSFEDDIGIYHKGKFDQVPESPGVYAWFYPLRLSNTDLTSLIREVNKVLSFDASVNGLAERQVSAEFAWERIDIRARRLPRSSPLPEHILTAWSNVNENAQLLDDFNKVLLRASVLMPPLYVGKTINLRVRCAQHLDGRDRGNTFHKRYEDFAAATNVRSQQIKDLLFVSLKTGTSSTREPTSPLEDVVEEVMKRLCRPAYSSR